MTIVDTSIAAASAAFSGLAAWGAWQASRQANLAAQESNATAGSVAQIERDRWHKELTPVLRLRLEAEQGTQGLLYVRFDGPASLGQITVSLTLRDDTDRTRVPNLGGTPTPEQLAEVIWGPYRFSPGINDADELGRSMPPFTLEANDRTRREIEPTLRPFWYDAPTGEERWRQQYRTARVRLWADCEAPGHKPWRLSFEVPQDGSWAQTGLLAGTTGR